MVCLGKGGEGGSARLFLPSRKQALRGAHNFILFHEHQDICPCEETRVELPDKLGSCYFPRKAETGRRRHSGTHVCQQMLAAHPTSRNERKEKLRPSGALFPAASPLAANTWLALPAAGRRVRTPPGQCVWGGMEGTLPPASLGSLLPLQRPGVNAGGNCGIWSCFATHATLLYSPRPTHSTYKAQPHPEVGGRALITLGRPISIQTDPGTGGRAKNC